MDRLTHNVRKRKTGGIPIRLPNGKTVGTLFGSVAAFKVKRSRHFFRNMGGYSLDAGIMAELERLGVSRIEFRDSELSQTFRISLETFMAHAKRCPDYGHGIKIAAHERFYQDDSADNFLPGIDTQGGGFAQVAA